MYLKSAILPRCCDILFMSSLKEGTIVQSVHNLLEIFFSGPLHNETALATHEAVPVFINQGYLFYFDAPLA